MAIHREQIKTSHAEWRKDTQGPCPKGFHIPTIDERSALINAGIDIQVWESGGGDDFRKKMLMPFAGYRGCSGTTASSATAVKEQGESGYYWSCSPSDRSPGTYAHNLSFKATTLSTTATNYRAYGFSLRPFKNEPVNPLNGEILQEGWIPIDGNLFWGQVIARNETLGLISLTYNEGHDCITIADKNLGATEAYYWDTQDPEAVEPTLSQANCGYYFQWGNNHGFAWTGTVSTTTTRVDTSQYGPGNYQDSYYSRSLYWYTSSSNRDWSLTPNDNLWGGATNKERYKRFSWVACSDMRGPCPVGFHVPTANERTSALNAIVTLEGLTPGSAGVQAIARDLHLPLAGVIAVGSTPPRAGNYRSTGYYRTSIATQNTSTSPVTYQAYALQLSTSSPYYEVGVGRRAFGYPVRAFRDTPVAPDSTWTTIFNGSSTATGAGIFWNEDEGLISLSTDGENWITMADKNVGATEVWTYTTVASGYTADNCGKFFVWGNNFGQPWASSGNYSPYQSTKIDTTGYGPGNYFNEDIVVTIGTAPDSDWSSVDNPNLWGGVSQGTWQEREYFKN